LQELLAFPESFARLEPVLKAGAPLLLKARVQIEEAGIRLSLQEARRLEDLTERAGPNEFRLRFDLPAVREEVLDQLEDLFTSAPGPCAVVFELCQPDGSLAVLQSHQRVKAAPELADAVRQICGEHAVLVVAA